MVDPVLQQHLNNLRTALARGMTDYLVRGLVMAALLGGCSQRQVLETAAEVSLPAARDAVRRALEEWARRQAERASVAAGPPPEGSAA